MRASAPPHYQCHLNERIGALAPAGTDHWWEIAAQNDVESVAGDLATSVLKFALPWLDRLADLLTAAEACRQRFQFGYAAVLANAAGAREVAESDLARALQRSSPRDALRVWATDQGLKPRPLNT
jgi:hypothetical protein